MGTNARAMRGECSWIARATSSLPVPLSPRTSTADSVGATRSMTLSTSCILALGVSRPPNGAAPAPSELADDELAQVALVVGHQHADLAAHSGSTTRKTLPLPTTELTSIRPP